MQNKRPFVITTDSMSDLPQDYLSEHGIEIISLTYTMDGQVYTFHNGPSYKEFYDRMRKGSRPVSSQFNPADAEKVFERLVREHGCDILHVSIGTGLSGSWNSAHQAASTVMERHPGVRILAFDTLGAALGQGLQVQLAVAQRAAGADIEETYAHLESLRDHVCHILTVEDIVYLYRGGRVSRTQAILGGILDIKPIIQVDNEGHLIPTGKVRGRKRSLLALVDIMEDRLQGGWKEKNQTIYISHGDSEEDARFLAEQVEKRFGFKVFMIELLGTTIGVHTGPGLIAMFFLGNHKL